MRRQLAEVQAAKTSLNSSDLFAPSTEVSGKDELAYKVKMLREENARLSSESKAAQTEKDRLESFLVDVKIRSANLDLENDQLACKLQQKSDMIKMLSERITALEVEVLRSKQELGEALNTVYEYEQTTADKAIVHNDSAGSDSQESRVHGEAHGKGKSHEDAVDGGSGSTVKKMSKTDKLKSFFKKTK